MPDNIDFQTISSLALAKVVRDINKDYLDMWLPFAAIAATLIPSSTLITPQTVQECIRDEFGVYLPLYILELILKRLVRYGFLSQEGGIFLPQPSNKSQKKVPGLQRIKSERAIFQQQQNNLIDLLLKYNTLHFPDLNWSPNQANEAFLAFAKKYGLVSIQKSQQYTVLPFGTETPHHSNYVVGKFLDYCRYSEVHVFKFAIDVFKTLILSNALLRKDIQAYQDRFKNTGFYFDSKIILRLLGWAGAELQHPMNDLLQLLQQLGAKLFLFQHNLEEIRDVLESVEHNMRSGKPYGEVGDYCLKSGKTPSDLAVGIMNLRKDIESKNIKIIVRPEYEDKNNKHQIDQLKFQSIMDEYKMIYYYEIAQARDIESVRSIYVLRGGKCPMKLEEANAIFVTTNQLLVKSARDYGRLHESTAEVSSCISASELTMTAWVKIPQQYPDVPENMMLADIMIAIRASDRFWEAVSEKYEQLKSEDNDPIPTLDELRSNPIFEQKLQEESYNDENELDVYDVKSAINAAKEYFERPLLRVIEDKDTQLSEVVMNRDSQLDELKSQLELKDQKTAKFADLVGLVFAIIVTVPCGLIFVFSSILVFAQQIGLIATPNPIVLLIFILSLAYLALMSVIGFITGGNWLSIIYIIKLKIKNYIIKYLI